VKHKKAWIWTLVGAGAALVILAALFASAVPLKSEILKRRIVETLSSRLNSDVTLDELSLKVFPRLHAEGKGLTIRDRRRQGVPPLIAIKAFTVDADLLGVWRNRVANVELQGLDISIPPDDDDDDDDPKRPQDHRLHGDQAIATSGSDAGGAAPAKPRTDLKSIENDVVIDTLVSENARLIIIPRKAGKNPKIWNIHTLTMHEVGATESMPFEATLTNAVPPGEIDTEGNFGPWDADHPGNTPLNGTFTFDRADLSVFKGISGTLSSRGSFGGSLDYIDVNGQTETPDFVISVGGHPFPLSTKYHAIVDGTNGDTLLEQIDAQFLKSTLVAKGAVLDGPEGTHGRTVSLDVTMPNARIEDVMRMAVKQDTPPMIGALQLTTKFLLPPGNNDVVDRLQLTGRFGMSNAKFTNRDVQSKLIELSHRGRGKGPEDVKEAVASDFKGRFALKDGRLELKDLMFAVPGAQVRLAGVYALKPETLRFNGNLLLDARISQTVSGWKSVLLKIVDPLFKKDGGGSSVPIKIEGHRDQPKFGLDMGRVFKRGD
jgi:hypothetical protein